ncbi:leucine carboxyl methyltransferase [Hyaloscypha variabilis F]|uniref:Leucine carboxyl methyltransferase 1 n=1 Tax=Hyaloscypha variabilis (strain UAMH 11265 / GT02V1 / F) TaxID=1149755 RepID=A0A2J6SAR6_HYAVF|nr:leucine carboxyl methyltransferase [Hyaloscypha variabilis F]
MSAQQIPNLLSLRGGPRSRGGRGRGRGPSTSDADHGISGSNARNRKDLDIQSTDTDAAVSRLSAVSLGYLHDPYAALFVAGGGTRRMPIINRGTYTRTTALDILINAFLAHQDPNQPQVKQIISLGAGTDTRYFRLRSQDKQHNLIYHEFDFPTVSETKRRTVLGNPMLSKLQEEEYIFPDPRHPPPSQTAEWGITQTKDGVSETTYCCHPLDLRQLPKIQTLQEILGLRNDIPTLVISECCLCYLDVDSSRDVVKWFSDRIPSLGIILYEPIGADDPFGQMMVANLAARGITMPSLRPYKTLLDQKTRLGELGFSKDSGGQEAETVEKIWEQWIPSTEKERVDSLEGLDEVEEWQMLARHYAVVWGWRGSLGWEGWNGLGTTTAS